MYVAVKGGEAAILNSYRLLAEQRRGDAALPSCLFRRSASNSSWLWTG